MVKYELKWKISHETRSNLELSGVVILTFSGLLQPKKEETDLYLFQQQK